MFLKTLFLFASLHHHYPCPQPNTIFDWVPPVLTILSTNLEPPLTTSSNMEPQQTPSCDTPSIGFLGLNPNYSYFEDNNHLL